VAKRRNKVAKAAPVRTKNLERKTHGTGKQAFKSVRGADIVEELEQDYFQCRVVLPLGVPLVLALWVLLSYCWDLFDYCPYLCVTSPVKRCGKTTIADLLASLCASALSTVGMTEAVLFRIIADRKPTLIIDEAESFVGKSPRSSGIVSILNAGFKKGGVVLRCVKQDVEEFPVFGPKMFTAIGTVTGTILDRSIVIPMRRKKPTQEIQPSRLREIGPTAALLKRQVGKWVKKHRKGITDAYAKTRLDFLSDRDADIWEPLFALAEVAVPTRIDELRDTAKRMTDEKAKLDTEESKSIQLLSDIRSIFAKLTAGKVKTEELLHELSQVPESPWRGMTNIELAETLRPFGIRPKQIWINDQNVRGYKSGDFRDAFDSYLPVAKPPKKPVPQPQPAEEAVPSGPSGSSEVL